MRHVALRDSLPSIAFSRRIPAPLRALPVFIAPPCEPSRHHESAASAFRLGIQAIAASSIRTPAIPIEFHPSPIPPTHNPPLGIVFRRRNTIRTNDSTANRGSRFRTEFRNSGDSVHSTHRGGEGNPVAPAVFRGFPAPFPGFSVGFHVFHVSGIETQIEGSRFRGCSIEFVEFREVLSAFEIEFQLFHLCFHIAPRGYHRPRPAVGSPVSPVSPIGGEERVEFHDASTVSPVSLFHSRGVRNSLPGRFIGLSGRFVARGVGFVPVEGAIALSLALAFLPPR